MNIKTIGIHITSALTGAAGVMALIHPGFHLPPFVQGLVASLCAVLACAAQVYHLASRNTLIANMAAVQHFATQAANAPTPPAAPAP